MRVRRLLRVPRRLSVYFALLGLVVLAPASSGATTKPLVISTINAYAGAGSHVVFEGEMGPKNPPHFVLGTEGTWLQKLGSQKLKLIATPSSRPSGFCTNDSAWEIMSVALGPKGTVGCLTIGGGISETDVAVYVALPDGKTTHPVGLYYSGGGEDDTPGIRPGLVPALLGDGHFFGYLQIASGGVVQLFRITTAGTAEYVADLTGLSSCGDKDEVCGNAAVDSGHIVIRQASSSDVHVFTTAGKPIATFTANVSPISGAVAIRKDRIVTLNAQQLTVYTLSGELVHSDPVQAWVDSAVSTYYGYAAYVGSEGRSVYVLKLSSGESHEIVKVPGSSYAPIRTGSFSLQQSGLSVGRVGSTGFVYVSWKKLRAKFH